MLILCCFNGKHYCHFYFLLDVVAILNYLAAFLLQYLPTILLADVLAMWQIFSPLNIVLVESDGRCYSHVADEKATYLVCHGDVIAQ